jgi:SAM-dependent methyltransferase
VQNVESWVPTKVVKEKDRYIVSRDRRNVAIGSRIITSLQLRYYESAIREHAKGSLLDLGCGHAPFYQMYRDQITECTCVDWENSVHKNELLDMSQDLNRPLDLPSGSFDTVLLTDVLEHISRPWVLFSEIGRVLRPGGKVIVGVPFFYWLHEEPFDFYRYTEHAIRSLCETNSLSVVSLNSYGGLPEIIADISAKCIHGIGMVNLCRLHVAICQPILDLWPVCAIRRRTAKAFPFGYVTVASKVCATCP